MGKAPKVPTIYKADEGKVWKSKLDGAVLSTELILGKNDSLANYEQIDTPVYPEDDELPS